MTIGVAINTKNEEKNIARAIKSVSFADQTVVVDMESNDQTVVIAKKLGAEIYQVEDANYVEPARNLALSKLKTDWTLVLDADEVIPPTLKDRLQKIAEGNFSIIEQADAYKLPRMNIMFGQPVWHTGWWPDYVLRFFKTGRVDWPTTLHAQPIVDGHIVTTPATREWAIEHYNYQSVEQFVRRMNRYTSIQAREKKNGSEVIPPLTSLFHELFRRLFLFEGYRDGQRGLSLSALQALSETVYAIKRNEEAGLLDTTLSPEALLEEIDNLLTELRYWRANLRLETKTGLSAIIWRLRRSLRI